MLTILNYVPKSVAPSKLEIVLSYCTELSDESKTKVCIITDIARIGKLLGNPPLSPHNFYTLYDMQLPILEAVQHSAQVQYNTESYHKRYNGSEL